MKKKLKLLYVWIKDSKKFRDCGFCLCDEYLFNVFYIADKFFISYSKNEDYIPAPYLPENVNIIAVTGENGCGKTFLLNTLAGNFVEKFLIFVDTETDKLYYWSNFRAELPAAIKRLDDINDFDYISLAEIVTKRKYGAAKTIGETTQENFETFFKNKIDLNHTNFCLDEIEIFQHPKTQRNYILNLINILKNNMNSSKYYNIILATKSPVVLSDFCKNQILIIDKKHCRICNESFSVNDFENPDFHNPFAGNIQEIFYNVLKINNPFGKLSEKFLQEIINYLNDTKSFGENKIIDIKSRTSVSDFIDCIGEGVLRNLLKQQLKGKLNAKNKKK